MGGADVRVPLSPTIPAHSPPPSLPSDPEPIFRLPPPPPIPSLAKPTLASGALSQPAPPPPLRRYFCFCAQRPSAGYYTHREAQLSMLPHPALMYSSGHSYPYLLPTATPRSDQQAPAIGIPVGSNGVYFYGYQQQAYQQQPYFDYAQVGGRVGVGGQGAPSGFQVLLMVLVVRRRGGALEAGGHGVCVWGWEGGGRGCLAHVHTRAHT